MNIVTLIYLPNQYKVVLRLVALLPMEQLPTILRRNNGKYPVDSIFGM
ncbi:hypothetical protein [Chitinophaga sp. S165]|nr:hypothetical protein [Chitinophaga sp. S165]